MHSQTIRVKNNLSLQLILITIAHQKCFECECEFVLAF